MFMTKQGTNMPNRTSVGQKGRGHGMAQHMRVDLLADPCLLCVAMKALPCALGFQAHWVLPLGDEERWMIIVPDIKILANPGQGRVGEIDFAWLIALPNDLSCVCFPI